MLEGGAEISVKVGSQRRDGGVAYDGVLAVNSWKFPLSVPLRIPLHMHIK